MSSPSSLDTTLARSDNRVKTLDPDVIRAVEAALMARCGKPTAEGLKANCPQCRPTDTGAHFYYNADKHTGFCQKCSYSPNLYEMAGVLGVTISRSSNGHDTGHGFFDGIPIVAVYTYQNPDGSPRFEVCRTSDKQFPPRTLDGKWGIKKYGIAPVLYHLPEVIAADPDKLVFIAEGEKDVDNLRLHGLVATCNPMGACSPGGTEKWRPEYSEYLKGRNVVILPDNDPAGRGHARHVADSLKGVAASVRILDLAETFELAEGGDVSDVLDQGLADQHLLELAAQAPELPGPTAPPTARRRMAFTADDLLDADLPEAKWLVPGMITEGLVILAGRPKMGKSWLALLLALAVGTGGVFLGERVEKGRVVYFALEDSPKRLKRRMKALGWSRGADVQFFFNLDPLGGTLTGLPAFIDAIKPDLVIIDTSSRAMPAGAKTRETAAVTCILDPIQQAAVQDACTVMMVDHYRKPQGMVAEAADHLEEVMDSTAKVAVADTIIGLARKRGERGATLKITGRDLEDDVELAIEHDLTTGCWQLLGNAEDVRQTVRQKKVMGALVKAGGTANVKTITERTEMDKSAVSRVLQELADLNKVEALPKLGREQMYRVTREQL